LYDILNSEDIMEMVMQVSKWGNSLAVRLPKALVEEMGLAEGDDVDIRALDRRTLAIAKAGDEEFLARLRALQKPAPEGFRWDRDEANAR
jgi:antitoxin MazE